MIIQRVNRVRLIGFVLFLLLFKSASATGAAAPTSVAQLALYQGADREQILVAGAKKEGQLT